MGEPLCSWYQGRAATHHPGRAAAPGQPTPSPPPPARPTHRRPPSCPAAPAEIEAGRAPRDNNLLVNAPHTADVVLSDKWDRPYSREAAAYPAAWVRQAKFWPTTSRVDNVYGDRHLVTRLAVTGEEPLAATA